MNLIDWNIDREREQCNPSDTSDTSDTSDRSKQSKEDR